MYELNASALPHQTTDHKPAICVQSCPPTVRCSTPVHADLAASFQSLVRRRHLPRHSSVVRAHAPGRKLGNAVFTERNRRCICGSRSRSLDGPHRGCDDPFDLKHDRVSDVLMIFESSRPSRCRIQAASETKVPIAAVYLAAGLAPQAPLSS